MILILLHNGLGLFVALTLLPRWRRLSWRRRRAVSTHKEASNRDYKRCPRGKNRVIPLCLPPNSFRGRMQGTLEAIFFLIWDHKWRQRRDVMMHGTLNFLYPLAIKLLKSNSGKGKGQLFRNVFLVSLILPKNEQTNSTLLLWYLKSNCFRSFFGRIEVTKKTFRN